MKKKELTPEERAERERLATHNRRIAGFVRSLKSEIAEIGLYSFGIRLEYLEAHPTTPLPKSYFSHSETVGCFKRAIQEYTDNL